MERLRKVWEKGSVVVDDDHFFILQESYIAGKEPEFKMGGIYFDVKTAGNEGLAAVAFSIWHRDRPIDEVSVQLCIADSPKAEKEKCKRLVFGWSKMRRTGPYVFGANRCPRSSI